MSALSVRLRNTAEWVDRMRDGPGVRELISGRLRELAASAEVLETPPRPLLAIASTDRTGTAD
jgi:hypothetical protein